MPALPQERLRSDQTNNLIDHYIAVRTQSEALCSRLEIEDWVVQPATFVSPPKWHLAHTSWFFVNFGLHAHDVDFPWPDQHFPTLFNSYYKSQSQHWLQGERGDLSRPTVSEILRFRRNVDEQVITWLRSYDADIPAEVALVIRLGIEHEQQHQELLLMDIKYILWRNPSKPALFTDRTAVDGDSEPSALPTHEWWHSDGGLVEFGVDTRAGEFCFDNESPQHPRYLHPYCIATSLVSNQDYEEFIDDGGYQNPMYWLSEGWDLINQESITAPLYWEQLDGAWHEYGLRGTAPLSPDHAVKHISFHEAYAYARWRGKRLPTEFEWEWYSNTQANTGEGQFLESTLRQTGDHASTQHLHGGLWEWTSSPYSPYPGYHATMDAFGEYNGKFMINQMVLRGGCLATPVNHYRPSYRNFYQPSQRWCFSGVRLAEDQQ